MYRRNRFCQVLCSVFLIMVFLAYPADPASKPANADDLPRLTGFTSEKSAWERDFESILKAIPDPAVCQENSISLSEHPNLVGSDWDWWNVQYSLAKLREYGFEPELHTYYVYMPEPRQIQVEMVAPIQYHAKVKEDGWPWQKYFDDVVVGYNAYSPTGDVTADLVYVNYGRPEDYARLVEMGVDVQSKIHVARYGKVFRGVKNKTAAEHGAVGLILFSDPADDGYVQGPVYPFGPWRPSDSIQRGTTLYLFDYSGDPLTPGWASTLNAPRLDPQQATSLPKSVPTTPLSYGEVAPLLNAMGGPAVPTEWQGGLPFTYHVGPGPAKVHLKLEIDYQIKPIWDIVVKIPGSKFPDQWVVLGTHRDGWTYGTSDSVSGWVVLLEMARSFQQLLAQGWQPERTIVLAGFDGEEYGQLGSTEWGEEYGHQLEKNAVAYQDLDSAGGGSYFIAAGVPSLDKFLYEITKEIEEPRTPGKSVYEDWVTRTGSQPPPIDRLGGGYDYQVFIDHLGVPTLQMVFDIVGGPYHSAYDDLYFMEHFADPGYLHHAAMAKLAGIAAMRLASADILPFQYSDYAQEVRGYLDQLNKLQIEQYGEIVVDFSREMGQALSWKDASLASEANFDGILNTNPSIPKSLYSQVASINTSLIRQERDLIQAKGLPDRPWFKHMIYAPGLYTGYAVQYLSALQDMLVSGDWSKVNNYRALLYNSLTSAKNTANVAGH